MVPPSERIADRQDPGQSADGSNGLNDTGLHDRPDRRAHSVDRHDLISFCCVDNVLLSQEQIGRLAGAMLQTN